MAEFLYEASQQQLRQGDIFAEMPFVRLALAQNQAGCAPEQSKTKRIALLLNQSCDVDKPGTTRLILLPVIPLASVAKDQQSLIKKNRILSYLHMPGFREAFPDSFLLFSEPMSVDKVLVERLPRLASLSPEMRRALVVAHTRFVTRWLFSNITCINCGITFDCSATMPIIND